MSRTARYRRQHAEIMTKATELRGQLNASKLATNALQARKVLHELSGKLIVHLATEDQLLYPELLRCQDLRTRTLAKQLVREMGPIAQTFKDYVVRWAPAKQIESRADEFVAETRTIIKALAERVKRENAELYPLVDRL